MRHSTSTPINGKKTHARLQAPKGNFVSTTQTRAAFTSIHRQSDASIAFLPAMMYLIRPLCPAPAVALDSSRIVCPTVPH